MGASTKLKSKKAVLQRTRAWRRFRREVVKRMVRDYHIPPNGPREVGMYSRTRQVCSCWMCGNPRRYSKGLQVMSLSERRSKGVMPMKFNPYGNQGDG